MNLIKEAAKLIGWLTGALAGIVAILYACGYLIIQTQLHLLGIDVLLPSGKEYYLQEGASFFIVTGQKLGLLLLGLMAIILIFYIPMAIVSKSRKGTTYVSRLKGKFLGIHERHKWLWQAAALLLMVVLLFFPLVNDLDLFRAPLELSGLLHTAQDDTVAGTQSSEAQTIGRWVTTGDAKSLDNFYYNLLMHCLFAALLLTAAQSVTSAWPLKSLIAFPFLLVFVIYLFLLPLDYVVLEKRIEFPAVTFISTYDKVSNDSGTLLLLNKTEREFILWDQAEKRALWLPGDKVVKVEIGRMQPVFKKNLSTRKEAQ
jgi:hypothetical protein